jgi:hypothetical protein
MALTNMTITAEEDVLRWARIKAAEENKSVARLVGEILRDKMRSDRAYADARRQHFAAIRSVAFTTELPKRDELHDRTGLR